MFIGRERELLSLNQLYDAGGFQMPVIYGRRRIGKTRLIREFCRDKRVIFYTGTQDEPGRCLSDFTDCIREYDSENELLSSMGSFDTWDAAFSYVEKLAGGERLVVVIDEYPYLAKSYPSISSILQRVIDIRWKNTNIFLVLSGSSMSFMEKQVLGYESPLYGRRTAQIKLEKLDYYDSVRFFPKWKAEDSLYAYGACGGVPQYLEIFSRWKNFKEAVIHEFLEPTGGLIDEPDFLLKEELREPALYNAIIEAIASGATKNQEISDQVKRPANGLISYLANLESLGIIEKKRPIEENSKKKIIYTISDNMFFFWYRFVPKCRYMIAMGLTEEAYDSRISPCMDEYFGKIFEGVCLEYILRQTAERKIGTVYDEYGKWWGSDPGTKAQEEIDIVAASKTDLLTAECKWQSRKTGYDTYNKLVYRTSLIRGSRDVTYYIFSKSGFDRKLAAADEPGLQLVSVGDML